MPLDAGEIQIDHLARRDATRPDGGRKLGSAREGIERHRGIL